MELMNLHQKTEGHHMKHIKTKLGIANIAALTRLAMRLSIISP